MGQGTFTVSNVVDNGGNNYTLTIVDTTGMTTGDHVGVPLSGTADAVYVISNVDSGTTFSVNDTLTEEHGGAFGVPTTGNGWYGTPKASGISDIPYGAASWQAARQRNDYILDLAYTPGGTDVPITDGGTGASTAAGAVANIGAGITGLTADASPDGAADYVLTYDDSASAAKKVLLNNLPGSGNNALLDGSAHTDTTAGTVARGDLVTGQGATATWTRLAKGTANQLLAMDGTATDVAWAGLSALLDATFSSTQGVVLYRGASAWAALGTGSAGQFLQTGGTGANPLWATVAGSSTNPLLDGTNHTDTTSATVARGDLITGQGGSPTWNKLALGSSQQILRSDGTDAEWAGISSVIDGAIGSTRGSILYRGASGWAVLTPGTSGHVLTSQGAGADPQYAAVGGGTNALLDGSSHTDTAAGTVVRGDIIVGNATPAWSRLAKGTANQVLTGDGTDTSWGSISSVLDGALGNTQGMVLRRGSSAWEALALGSDNTVLASDGTDVAYEGISSLLDSAIGSTRGSVLYRGASGWAALTPGTSGHVLSSQGAGADPQWAAAASGGDTRQYLHYRWETTSGTDGGSGTSATWTSYGTLTEVADTGNDGSVSSGTITLGAGTYEARIYGVLFFVLGSRLRLRNTSDSVTVALSTTNYESAACAVQHYGTGRFTIGSSKNFELQYYFSSSSGTYDLGRASGSGEVEVYAGVEFYKVE